MKAAAGKSLRDTPSTGAVELLVAELRARRKHLQNLVRLVNEQAGREYGNTAIPAGMRRNRHGR